MINTVDPVAVVNAAADATEKRYGVTIHNSARSVLLRWAENHPDQLRRMALEHDWRHDQFVDAAAKVFGAAAIHTMNPPGSIKYIVEPPDIVRDKDVGAAATLAVLMDNCPFYGFPGC